jgi:hypothetical protein
VKLIAAVFLLPSFVLGALILSKHRPYRALAIAVCAGAAIGALPYLYAWAKTGNPVFPFSNTIFRSPYFDTTTSFADLRFSAALNWMAPFDVTFRSGRYFEGNPGGAGLQYLPLILPALLLVRRRDLKTFAASGLVLAAVLLAVLPNLRYMYPALALLSVPLAAVLAEWPIAGTVLFLTLTALNLYLLPSSNYYHRGFALFTHQEETAYVEHTAPDRPLIETLNRIAPGEPVAFFGSDEIAGLHATAYADTWHTEHYWASVRNAHHPQEIAQILRDFKIRNLVAPLSFDAPFLVVRAFLRQYAEPTGIQVGTRGIFHLRDRPRLLNINTELPTGTFDDQDERIEFVGRWLRDRQFPQSLGQSLTYSTDPADQFGFWFTGRRVTWFYTKAANRGMAVVRIDGAEVARLNLYSKATQWQSQSVFEAPAPGNHSFAVEILPGKDPLSTGRFVDVDRIVVTD